MSGRGGPRPGPDPPGRPGSSTRRSVRGGLPDLAASLDLVRLHQAGDETALNELFARYRDRLQRIVAVRMGPVLRDLMDEEDIVQEVFIVAARRISAFEPTSHGSILRWLASIAENKLRQKAKFHTREKRDARLEVRLGGAAPDASGAAPPDPVAPGPSPSQRSVWLEIEELVDECLSALEPPTYREVVLQRDYFGASWEELRDALERPSVAAVQELYRRAHAKLREALARRLA